MNKLYISPEAQNDLMEIKEYIQEELNSPSAADHTLSSIIKRIRQLCSHANMGARLSSITAFESDYRMLVCGNYLAFYRVYGTEIFVDRILYGKRDYLRILFGETEETEE